MLSPNGHMPRKAPPTQDTAVLPMTSHTTHRLKDGFFLGSSHRKIATPRASAAPLLYFPQHTGTPDAEPLPMLLSQPRTAQNSPHLLTGPPTHTLTDPDPPSGLRWKQLFQTSLPDASAQLLRQSWDWNWESCATRALCERPVPLLPG